MAPFLTTHHSNQDQVRIDIDIHTRGTARMMVAGFVIKISATTAGGATFPATARSCCNNIADKHTENRTSGSM